MGIWQSICDILRKDKVKEEKKSVSTADTKASEQEVNLTDVAIKKETTDNENSTTIKESTKVCDNGCSGCECANEKDSSRETSTKDDKKKVVKKVATKKEDKKVTSKPKAKATKAKEEPKTTKASTKKVEEKKEVKSKTTKSTKTDKVAKTKKSK